MTVLDILSWPLLVGGGLISIVAGIGLLRFPDLYTRMHAGSMLDTLGAFAVVMGLVLQAVRHDMPAAVVFKLVLVFVFLAFTTATAGHALAKSALASGVRPLGADGQPLPVGGVLASRDDLPGGDTEVTSSQS